MSIRANLLLRTTLPRRPFPSVSTGIENERQPRGRDQGFILYPSRLSSCATERELCHGSSLSLCCCWALCLVQCRVAGVSGDGCAVRVQQQQQMTCARSTASTIRAK